MSSEPLTIAICSKALDGLTMRMSAIAYNLANASSPRFQEVKVDFEDALRAAAARGGEAVDALHFESRAGHIFGPGEDRRIDLMVADASQTAMRYSALVDMLGRRMSLQSAVIGGQG